MTSRKVIIVADREMTVAAGNRKPGFYKPVPKGLVRILKDGTTVYPEFDLIPVEKKKLSLKDIWKSADLSLETFMLFCSRANWKSRRLIEEAKNGEFIFTGGAMEMVVMYEFLSQYMVVKQNLKATEIFQAFAGSFTLSQVSNPRALQDRQRNEIETRQYNKRKAAFRKFFEDLFQFIVRNPTNEQNETFI
jgi:hypothetical protein